MYVSLIYIYIYKHFNAKTVTNKFHDNNSNLCRSNMQRRLQCHSYLCGFSRT